jgi:hypothetical protein
VPNVVGETQAQAETDITAAGLTFSESSAYSATVAVGLVISQNPVGGTLVNAGSAVAIVLSLGPQPVPTETPAGGKIRSTIYMVEVEGKKFFAPTLADALRILAKTKELAKKHAQTIARQATEKTKPNTPVRPIRIPRIRGSDPVKAAAVETQKEIKAIYESALRDAEIAMWMELDKRVKDDEETILLLM